MGLAVEAGAGAVRVVKRDRAGAVERGCPRDADERAVERATGERAANDGVLAGGQEQRQRRRALAEVDAGDLPRLEAVAGAVEDVVRDLEGDAERDAEVAERRVAPAGAEQAGGLEQLRRFQRA